MRRLPQNYSDFRPTRIENFTRFQKSPGKYRIFKPQKARETQDSIMNFTSK